MSTQRKRGRTAWHYLIWRYPQPEDGGHGKVTTMKATDLSEIARKTGVGYDGFLPWGKGRAIKYFKGRILAKGDDPDELIRQVVHSTQGRLLEAGEKAFTAPVLQARVEKSRDKKKDNKSTKFARMESCADLLEERAVYQRSGQRPSSSRARCSPDAGASKSSSVLHENTLMSSDLFDNTKEARECDVTCREFFSSEALVSSLRPLLENHCSWEHCKFLKSIVYTLKPKVKNNLETRAVVQFLEALIEEAEKQASVKVEMNILRPKFVQLDEHYFSKPKVGDSEKVRLFKDSDLDFYVHPAFLAEINVRMQPQNTWQRFVDLVLNKLYGKNLKFLSAEGKRNTQGINAVLYKGFLRMAKAEDSAVTEREVTHHVNMLINNVKGCWRRRQKSLMKEQTLSENIPVHAPESLDLTNDAPEDISVSNNAGKPHTNGSRDMVGEDVQLSACVGVTVAAQGHVSTTNGDNDVNHVVPELCSPNGQITNVEDAELNSRVAADNINQVATNDYEDCVASALCKALGPTGPFATKLPYCDRGEENPVTCESSGSTYFPTSSEEVSASSQCGYLSDNMGSVSKLLPLYQNAESAVWAQSSSYPQNKLNNSSSGGISPSSGLTCSSIQQLPSSGLGDVSIKDFLLYQQHKLACGGTF